MYAPHVSVIAHRGASAYAPEHNFAAYDLALAMGANAIELDLRETLDGELVVLHDATLERTAGDPRRIAALTRRDLEALDESVTPLALDDVFARYGAGTRYWIEIKDARPDAERTLVDAIWRHALLEQVTVQSFDRLSLRRICWLDRSLPRVALYRPGARPGALRRSTARIASYANGIGPSSASVNASVVLAAHACGLTVQPYTVNDRAEMKRLVELGVDGIFTDAPDRLRAVITATVRTQIAA